MQLKRIASFTSAVNNGTQRKRRYLCPCLLVLALVGALPCFAKTVTVTNTNDSGAGSLRNAIATAASGDTINFSVSLPATITVSGTLSICNGQTLTISGPGASQLAISGGGNVEVFGICLGTNVTISHVTIENGSSFVGAGIDNNGTLTVTNSTLSGNSAVDSGGGIFNEPFSTLTVTNSTLSSNFGYREGGGILNLGTLTVTNSTLSGNSTANADTFGGGIGFANGSATLKGTLLAGNSNGNCYEQGTNLVASAGYNLSDDATCASAFTQTGDKNSTPAGLDPKGLQNNGGPTQTIALLPGSPAVDAMPVASCTDTSGHPVTTDQRGVARPQGPACDIGSFELVEAVQFSSFSARLAILTGKPSGFALTAGFTLQAASDGIHPLTEAVTLQIANYTVTIPAGSFHQLWKAPQAPYAYNGTINGTNLLLVILPLGGNRYQFDAGGSPVTSLAGTKNPVTVSLTVGNDTGSTSVKAIISPR